LQVASEYVAGQIAIRRPPGVCRGNVAVLPGQRPYLHGMGAHPAVNDLTIGLGTGAIVRERIPKRFGFDPIRDIQVLCPMNRGGLGARSLNIELQKELNPPGEIRIERFGCPGAVPRPGGTFVAWTSGIPSTST
jgi:hypothetical protein